MAATVVTTGATNEATTTPAMRGMQGTAQDLKGRKYNVLRVEGVATGNTLVSGWNGSVRGPLPERMVFAAWEPDTTTEHCNVAVTAPTSTATAFVTFYTSGATNYNGYLHIWSVA